MVDKPKRHHYNNHCSVEKPEHARVAQWWSIALPRRGSRVRIPSRAFFIASEIKSNWFPRFFVVYNPLFLEKIMV